MCDKILECFDEQLKEILRKIRICFHNGIKPTLNLMKRKRIKDSSTKLGKRFE